MVFYLPPGLFTDVHLSPFLIMTSSRFAWNIMLALARYTLPTNVNRGIHLIQDKCTLPSDSDQVNYVSSQNTRGTLKIAWSCTFTIIA